MSQYETGGRRRDSGPKCGNLRTSLARCVFSARAERSSINALGNFLSARYYIAKSLRVASGRQNAVAGVALISSLRLVPSGSQGYWWGSIVAQAQTASDLSEPKVWALSARARSLTSDMRPNCNLTVNVEFKLSI